MEILTRERCNDCNGEGVVQHPAWKDWHDKVEAMQKTGLPYLDCLKALEDVEPTDVPSEEKDCGPCGGSGWVQTWIPATLDGEGVQMLMVQRGSRFVLVGLADGN